MFIGRDNEIEKLQQLKNKKTSNLVVVLGRRRIGKSTLIKNFAKPFANFYEFAGLAPNPHQTNIDQLNEFYLKIKKYSKNKAFEFPNNWTMAFEALAELTKTGENLIFLDEISWMGNHDSNFSGKLKIIWDEKLSQNPKNFLVLCGSVSSWIEDNILMNSDFVGRISSEIHLQELSLPNCNYFWGKNKNRISSFEKLKILSITGGIPKYLEEIDATISAEENIRRLCFQKEGFLFREYDRIFSDIFTKRAPIYKKILLALIDKSQSNEELSKKLKLSNNGDFAKLLHHLKLAGFIERYHTFSFTNGTSKLSRVRLNDNYLRFYFKYILPNQQRILQSPFQVKHLEQLLNWHSTFGLLFESLILKNQANVAKLLAIDSSDLLWTGPFFQNKTTRNKGACQIDLLLATRFNCIFVCEIKTGQQLNNDIISEVQRKIEVIQAPKRTSFRPVLIVDEITSEKLKIKCESYFDKIIYFEQLFDK